MKWPFVTRRYAEYLEQQVQELKEQNAGFIRTAFAFRGLGDPFAVQSGTPTVMRPIGRKRADQLLKEMEAAERVVKPESGADGAH